MSEAPIDLARFVSGLGAPGHGAQNLFFGAVRETNHGKRVLAVSYDAFAPLAEATLRDICGEAAGRWGEDLRFRVLHRTGRLGVGELSVAIGVSSRHREESYQASRYVIEELKKRAPIWKKEHYEGGETEWLKGHALCQGHQHERV
ncbi:MAG: molybdenum cofactor biosynthesis protein MoaE [Bdellovibrionales bacterium]|nr:molybdenum cofactor biosynthesis protein MoaE [Bdellovibrionales bacterium]